MAKEQRARGGVKHGAGSVGKEEPEMRSEVRRQISDSNLIPACALSRYGDSINKSPFLRRKECG